MTEPDYFTNKDNLTIFVESTGLFQICTIAYLVSHLIHFLFSLFEEIDAMELLINKFEETILEKSYASEEQFSTLMTMAEHDNDDKWFEGK